MDIPSISAVVAAIGVLVGVVFTVLELRNLVKTRQTDLVMRLYSAFGGKDILDEYKKVLNLEPKNYMDFSGIFVFFEAVGILLRRKLIDIALVDDFFSSPIILSWEKLRPIVEEAREKLNRPQASEWFEYLYNEMQKREQQLATIQ
jgi:hypothetical protein